MAQTYSPVWVTPTQAYPFAMSPAHNGWLAVGTLRIGKGDELAYWFARFDTNGTMLWQQLSDTTEGAVFSSVIETPFGFLVGGAGVDSFFNGWHESDTAPEDAALEAIDANGNPLWGQCYGGSQNDELTQVIATHDGGYAFVGTTSSSDGDIHDFKDPNTNPEDVWIEKVDSLGGIEWERTFGGSNVDLGIGIAEMPDHSFGVIANTHSNDGDVSQYFGNYDIWLLHIDSVGNMLWNKTFGSTLDDAATGIAAASDGTMLIVGQRNFQDSSGAELPALWAAKIDSAGRTLWELDDTSWQNYLPSAIAKTPANNLLIAGGIQHTQQSESPFIVMLNSQGTLAWVDTFSIGSGLESPFVNSILFNPNGGFAIAGTAVNDTNRSEGFVASFAALPLLVRSPASEASLQIFPSPAVSTLTIRTPTLQAPMRGELYNVLGQSILTFNSASSETRLDVSRLPRGVYYIETSSASGVAEYPVVLE